VLAAMLAVYGTAGGAFAACHSRAPAQRVTGRWDGVITGRELAQSTHIIDIRVALSILPDGRWEMSTDLGDSAGVVATAVGDQVELDGHLGGAKGPPVWNRMTLWRGDVLVGLVHTHFSGSTVVTGIVLRRVQGGVAAGRVRRASPLLHPVGAPQPSLSSR
jgi:hypothetical protein